MTTRRRARSTSARGYHAQSRIPDFYAPGDDQVVYVKYLERSGSALRRTGTVMETWQEVLRKNSIASLEALAIKFGPENFPELDRLRIAAENFEFRISPAMVDLIKEPNDPIWRQYVPTVEELDVVDGIVDSLNEDADSPVPNITHRYPDRALFLVSPGLRLATAGSAPGGARSAIPRRSRCRSSSRPSSTSSSTPRSGTSSCRAAIRCCSTTGGSTRS